MIMHSSTKITVANASQIDMVVEEKHSNGERHTKI